jgi:hypothetical protein
MPFNDNAKNSQQTCNSTSSTVEKYLISPITNILLSSSTAIDLADQVTSNIGDQHICTDLIQTQTNHTIDSIMFLNTSETYDSIINNQNSHQSKGKLFCNLNNFIPCLY